MNDELKTQLTAWALDELPPDERSEIDARLGDLPEAKAYAQDTREFCTLLSHTLAPAGETTLSPEQRTELARQFRAVEPSGKVVRFRPAALAWVAGLGAVAAALVLLPERFLGPASPNVAMQPATNTHQPARETDFLRQNVTFGDAPVDDSAPSDQRDKNTALGRLSRSEQLGEEQADRAAFLSLAQNDPRGSDSTSRSRAAKFGSNPEPAGATLADLSAVEQQTGLGAEVMFEKENLMTRGLQPSLKPADAASLPQSLLESRAAGSSAATPLASVQPEPAKAPSDPASLDERRMKLKSSVGTAESAAAHGNPASGKDASSSLTADTKSIPSLDQGRSDVASSPVPPSTPARLAAVEPSPVTDFDTSAGFRLFESEAKDDGLSRGAIAGSSTREREEAKPAALLKGLESAAPAPELTTSGTARVRTADGFGGLEKARALSEQLTDNLSFEVAPSKAEAELQRHYYFRYATPTPPESTAESYAAVPENPFKAVAAEPVSTFSTDVDTAAYANVRRFLNQGQRPPQPAVRLEEMVNYFRYDYPQPEAGKPFSVIVDLADCPWQSQHRLARVGLKGREVATDKRPQSNLVFLVDVSGSMDDPNKLPLVHQSLRMLSSQLGDKDRVAIVTYAGDSGLALDSTSGADRAKITTAIDRLTPGGSTNGGSGIQLAYDVAQQHFVKEGVNRVILATDGDFNVGVTSQEALQKLIADRAKGGVFLSVLGYGMGNLKDSTMEMLADKGNGNYAYIDSLSEARKVLSEEMSGTLVTIAKDVKVQIEFNPAVVRGYRLLGYENRMLAREDFNDDTKDAGEIGAGHTVTAFYELVPVGAPPEVPLVDGLKYTPAPIVAAAAPADARKPIDPAIARETMTVKLRYKAPDGETSQLIEVPVVDKEAKFVEAPADFKFAASVIMLGMLLKDSAHKGTASWDQVRQFALQGKGPDPLGYRGEFIQLVEKARGVAP